MDPFFHILQLAVCCPVASHTRPGSPAVLSPRAAVDRLGLLPGLPYPGLTFTPGTYYWTPQTTEKKKLNELPSLMFARVSSFIVLCPQASWGASLTPAFLAEAWSGFPLRQAAL